MADKIKWVVCFKFMELGASHYWHSVEVEGTDIGQALRNAWKAVRKKSHVKGKRISTATVTIEKAE